MKSEPMALATGFDYARICQITPEDIAYRSGKVSLFITSPCLSPSFLIAEEHDDQHYLIGTTSSLRLSAITGCTST
jgi:hypothetical protein